MIKEIPEKLRKIGWMSMFESILMAVTGIFVVLEPSVTIRAISYVVGIFFLVKGAYRVVNYFFTKGKYDYFNNDLVYGMIAILVGLGVVIAGQKITGIFRIVIGAWLIYAGLVRLDTAIKMKARKVRLWAYVLGFAITMFILGAIVLFYEGAILTLVGCMMIVAGVLGAVDDIMFISSLKDDGIQEGKVVAKNK